MKYVVIVLSILLTTNILAWDTDISTLVRVDDEKKEALSDDLKDTEEEVKRKYEEVKDVRKNAEKWSKDKYEAAKAGMTPEAQERSKEAQDVALAINTFAEYGSSLGLSDDIMKKVNSAVYGYNAWLNGDLGAYFGQKAVEELLTKSQKEYFKLCYTEQELTDGAVLDPCSLIPDIDADPCSKLPKIPGYTKISLLTDDLTKAVYEETNRKLPLGKELREMCKKRLDAKKKNPNEKTSTAEKIKNNNPKGAREDFIKATENSNVKEKVKHSDLLSTKRLTAIKLIKKDSNGKKVKFNPYEDLNQNNAQSKDVEHYLEELATKAALEGDSKKEIQKLIRILGSNPKAVNTTFENKGQYEDSKAIITSSMYGTYELVVNYETLIEDAIKTTKEDPSGTSDLVKIYEDKYAVLIKDWVNSEKAYIVTTAEGYNTPTKDFVDNMAKGSKNELFTRISTVTKINRQMNQQAHDITLLKIKALKMKKKFSKDLKIAIIGAMEFDINNARIAAGLEPYPDVVDPIEAMKEMAIDVAEEEVQKQLLLELKYLNPLN